MVNLNKILKDAHSFFAAKQYDKAMFLYSQISSINPTNDEYKLYALLCDIASENDEKGQSLFDYFTIAKETNIKDPVTNVLEIINTQDGDHNKMMELLHDIATQSIQSLEAVDYEDFKQLVKQKGSFKTAYEDIMFSTKVAIKGKQEFLEFVEQLIENNFIDVAFLYLDELSKFFKYDPTIIKLYEKLGKLSSDNKTQ